MFRNEHRQNDSRPGRLCHLPLWPAAIIAIESEHNFENRYKGEQIMDLMQLVITLVIIGALMWFVNAYIIKDKSVRQVLNIFLVIAAVLWVGSMFGVFDFI